jgi:hypothetical protein
MNAIIIRALRAELEKKDGECRNALADVRQLAEWNGGRNKHYEKPRRAIDIAILKLQHARDEYDAVAEELKKAEPPQP